MKDIENRNGVEFDRLHEKDYSDRLIYGNSTLTEFEKSFISDSVDYNLEYVGAPCGVEDNAAKGTYLEFNGVGHRYRLDYPKEGVNSRQFINLNKLDEEFNKQCVKEFNVWEDFMQRVDDKHYSNLSNISINKGQEDMFSFTNNSSADTPERVEKANKTYRPLPDCLTIKESSIDGLGLFSTRYIDKGTVIGKSHHYIKTPYSDELIRTPLSGFCNHSSNPNCTIEECEDGMGDDWSYKSYNLVASRYIVAGDELTLDYRVEICGLSGYDGAEFLNK